MTEVRNYRGNGHGEFPGQFAQRPERGLAALQDAVRENPLPAALIGMGVFWMFMGGSNVSLFGGGRKSLFGTAAHGAQQFTGAVQQGGASLGASVGGAMQGMAQPAWQAGSTAASAMGDAAAVMGDAASRTAARAADVAASTTDMASRSAETMANATTAAASAVQDSAAKLSTGIQRTLTELLERRPLLLGAVGLAIGAGIAASVPITEAEKQAMGEASDFVPEKVGEKAAQGITSDTVTEAVAAVGKKMTGDKSAKERTASTLASSSRGNSGAASRKT
jgi:hypothetical protein